METIQSESAKKILARSYDGGHICMQNAVETVEKAEKDMRDRAIKVYRNLFPSYKVQTRYECGNYSHQQEWKTKVCDMNCEYMKKF